MRKRKILVLCLALLAAAAALLLRQDPEELRQEVLSYVEAQTDFSEFFDVWEIWDEETGRMLSRHMSDWEAGYDDLKGSIFRAEELRKVSSVPEPDGPVFRFGERMVGGGGKIYYLYPGSRGAIEISLEENDGYWLDLYAVGNDRTDTAARAYFREKMKERVLAKFSPGDSDECLSDYEIEIKTQEGLELLLRCIENADVYDMAGATSCAEGSPYVYVGGMCLGGDSYCGYGEPGTWRSADLRYSNDDSEALREYINAAFAAQTQ